ncbi:Gfo/Idh/MocA family oxidoreductase [Sansalvadorimonas sp. 2012CJ34-2]|uniref:Gfo/Idh/MocA family oxidoreductase n=1 Tax=Parendozoicomonas callyspongiae TaxID=2942213 RepID=A0ABT0PIS1_9GAMM|nr:Gfo/Idh/MocA family oxidoreductase [Sansalvadorimonas sp. 2012CJ34-2]MCL6271294.1 Gfo/Idh/MocA family oxidoreductase [Sansalvadorimonas sp. 2012CJ34-2]
MIRYAVIGTSWISSSFIEAAKATDRFQLMGVYSRDIDRAREFAGEHKALYIFDNLEHMAQSDLIDAVYIASPNSMHCQQSCLFLNHGKHVICEKPVASNLKEAERMVAAARNNNAILFEAFKTCHLPNFYQVQKALPALGKVHKAHLNYCQYSSRYQRYLDGENPNTFNPAFSNGSIMDIGFYCLSTAVALWGEPKKVSASAHLLESGVDAHGSVVLHYSDMDVILQHSKVSDSFVPSEIQGEAGSLVIKQVSECQEVTLYKKNATKLNLTLHQENNTMFYEAQVFADLIDGRKSSEQYLQNSLTVARLLTDIRKQTKVVFPADR